MPKKEHIEWDKALWECEEGVPEDELDPELRFFDDDELEAQVLSDEDMLLLDDLGLDDCIPPGKLVDEP